MRNNVLVVGAGPAGLCLSLALARRGLSVDLVERQEVRALAAPAFDGREIALNHASMRLLRELGVWRRIPESAIAPLRRARIMDGAGAGFVIDGVAFGHARLGALVPNHRIRAAAWEAVADEPGVRVHAGAGVEAVGSDDRHAWVRLVGGPVLEAALLVASDGRFSESRRAMGIAAYLRDCGMSMLVCRMRHAKTNDATAWEWFGHGQTRALLPLDDHLASVVLTLPDGRARVLQGLTPEAFAADVTARFEGRLGAMQLASTIHRYPLVATWAHRFVSRRFALAGDAAVGMHPVTAHGFNLGLASVEHLAQAVADGVRVRGDPADADMLARYQRRHRASSALLFAGTRAVVGLFTSDHRFLEPARSAVMQAGRRLPPVRRALAAGVLDNAPRAPSIPHHLHTIAEVLRPRLRAARFVA